MSNIYFIADTHFGHANIIKYENRPFQTVEEMDQKLIESWNTVVNEHDTIYMLGDFSFHGHDRTYEICHSLSGRKSLIMGNHDSKSPRYYMECGFEYVYKYPIILDSFWMLSHEPLYVNENMPYGNIYGHVHGSKTYADYSQVSYCACVERINYTPISWEEIKKKMLPNIETEGEQL